MPSGMRARARRVSPTTKTESEGPSFKERVNSGPRADSFATRTRSQNKLGGMSGRLPLPREAFLWLILTSRDHSTRTFKANVVSRRSVHKNKGQNQLEAFFPFPPGLGKNPRVSSRRVTPVQATFEAHMKARFCVVVLLA